MGRERFGTSLNAPLFENSARKLLVGRFATFVSMFAATVLAAEDSVLEPSLVIC
jgi:hypothetical protein